MRTHTHTDTCAYTRACLHTHADTCARVHTPHTGAHAHTYVYTHTHTLTHTHTVCAYGLRLQGTELLRLAFMSLTLP